MAKTDICHQTLSGPATKKLFERGYYVFTEQRYERLAHISVAHIYNLRKREIYCDKRRHFTKTQRTTVNIGERRKPAPNGAPGYLRSSPGGVINNNVINNNRYFILNLL